MEIPVTDNSGMENGIDQLLGLIPYKNFEVSAPCQHEDDGYIYGETMTKQTLRCENCGEYYEQRK